jgi:hypothetical protein
MVWGTVTIGGVAFREELLAEGDSSSLHIGGQEAHPPKTRLQVEAAHHNIKALADLVVPVVFTDKSTLTGFYLVTSSSSALFRWANGRVQHARWEAQLERIGSADDVEIESRVPLVARPDELPGTQTAVFWHAPPVGVTSYLTGPTSPTSWVDRDTADGIIRVWLGLPIDSPRWTVRAGDYLAGSARIVLDSIRRAGTFTPPGEDWELSNGLVRVTPGASGRIAVSCWDAGEWRSANEWAISVGGTVVTTTPELTILRNDPEEARIRLTYPGTPGRLTVDLRLRRGARFVTGVLKRHSTSLLAVVRNGTTAGDGSYAAFTGGIRAAATDADGNRWVLGTSRVSEIAHGAGDTALSLDFYIGHELNAAAPAAGDAAADLFAQYLGSTGERIRVVRR